MRTVVHTSSRGVTTATSAIGGIVIARRGVVITAATIVVVPLVVRVLIPTVSKERQSVSHWNAGFRGTGCKAQVEELRYTNPYCFDILLASYSEYHITNCDLQTCKSVFIEMEI